MDQYTHASYLQIIIYLILTHFPKCIPHCIFFSFVSSVGDLYSVQFHRNIVWRLYDEYFSKTILATLGLTKTKQNKKKTKTNKKKNKKKNQDKDKTKQKQKKKPKNKNKTKQKNNNNNNKKQLCSSDCKIPLASTKCKLLALNAKNELYIMWVYKLFDLLSVTV